MSTFFRQLSHFLSSDSIRIPPTLFLLFIVLFSCGWLLGYEVYEGDQLIYFPELLQRLDPTLFSNDLIFSQDGFTFFDDVLLFIESKTPLDLFTTLFLVTLAVRFVYVWGLYRIFLSLTGARLFSLILPLFYLSAFVVYGTGMRTIAPMLLPRDIGIAFGLAAFGLLLGKKRLLASLLLSVGVLFHPAISIPFLIIFYLSFFVDREKVFSSTPLLALGMPVLSFLILFFSIPPGDSLPLFTTIDSVWREVILRRDSYYFLTTWYYPNSAPLYIVASIFMFFFVRTELTGIFSDRRKRLFIYACFLVPILLSLASLLLADWMGLLVAIQFSLGRSLLLWKIVINGLFLYAAYRHLRDAPRDFFYTILVCGVALSFLVSENIALMFVPALATTWFLRTYGNSLFPQLPFLRKSVIPGGAVLLLTSPLAGYFAYLHESDGFFETLAFVVPAALFVVFLRSYVSASTRQKEMVFSLVCLVVIFGILISPIRFSITPSGLGDAPFLEACEWIKAHTSKDAVFVTEPFSSRGGDIRFLCKRSLFAIRKDGGQVVFNRAFALEWWDRYMAIKEMEKTPGYLDEVVKRYQVSHVFSDKDLARSGLLFDNGLYRIYSLR